jgi:MSHA biogenesis protein MshJ
MNKLRQWSEKLDALSLRERALIVSSILALAGFLWWNLYVQPLLESQSVLEAKNTALVSEVGILQQTIKNIQDRINGGVQQEKMYRLNALRQELQNVSEVLEQKTLELIEPEEMFELMQQLIFAESKLKVISIKRKSVTPVFSQQETEKGQPEIYRHVLQMSFEGKYVDVLKYIGRLEGLSWKLIWDRIALKTTEYPIIRADIEISTLSGHQHWVGL